MKETKACIESSTAPALYCMVAYFIKFINDWKHLLCCNTGCNQGWSTSLPVPAVVVMAITGRGSCARGRPLPEPPET